MADTFTRDRLRWLDLIFADTELDHLAFRVAYLLSQLFNREKGNAWPAVGTLAKGVGASSRGVQKAVAQLEARGYLTRDIGRGRGGSNSYRPILNPAENTNSSAHFATPKNMNSSAPPEQQCTPGVNSSAPGGRTAVHPNPFDRTPLKEPFDESPSAPAVTEDPFEGWFRQYPRQWGKSAAKQQYEKVTRAGRASPDELLLGAMRYAEERTGQDPRFTKLPANWLLEERWHDQPGNVVQLRDRSPTRSNLEVALEGLRR